jgi:hypothetical protein
LELTVQKGNRLTLQLALQTLVSLEDLPWGCPERAMVEIDVFGVEEELLGKRIQGASPFMGKSQETRRNLLLTGN